MIIRALLRWLFVADENRDYTTTGGNTPLPMLLKQLEGKLNQEVR